MHPSFERLIAHATRLTRAGDLRAATRAIQAALRGATPPAANDDWVVDVQAREVDVERDVEAPAPPRPAGDAGLFLAGSHTHAAGTRDYKLYVPPGYRGQPLPLVVMLHGCTQDPDDFAAGTCMNEAADERDFFVLYPAQSQGANPSRCWNWFKHNHQRRGRGEPALLADLVRAVTERYGIDAQRVYVAGLSAGGAMAAIVGNAYPDVFAAVGVHSGLPPGSATNVKTAFEAMHRGPSSDAAQGADVPPTIVFHGDLDTTVHPVNGQQVTAAAAGATPPELERGRSENGREFTRHLYRDAEGRIVAEHWVVHGAGHAWSGGSPRGSYTDATGPDATREMLRFFFARRLGQPGSN
jgi:poly(hydroxyalkanoate) depolymerase family esterase